jgi:hypothetical protein
MAGRVVAQADAADVGGRGGAQAGLAELGLDQLAQVMADDLVGELEHPGRAGLAGVQGQHAAFRIEPAQHPAGVGRCDGADIAALAQIGLQRGLG